MPALRRARREQTAGAVAIACILMVATVPPATGQVVLPPGLGQPAAAQIVPSPAYDAALEALDEGDYAAALAAAATEYQRGVKIGPQRWIDTIASAAVVGECQFERGAFRDAVAAYEEAMLMAATQGDWLLAVQFPPQPLRAAPGRAATWGRSTRAVVPAIMPETMTIRRGGADPETVLQKGGTLVAPADYPLRPEEIMRSLVIAIYRHADILGELSRESTALSGVTKVLGQRPAPPNHYSQAWISIALGTALWSQGKADQAVPILERGLLVGDGLDHGLTAWGLIVLGRIAFDAGRVDVATKLFEEATYSALDATDGRALEEAFRLAFMAHMTAGTRGVPATIRGGCDWARGNHPVLRATLLAMQAEAAITAGDRQTAAASLKAIDGRLGQSDPGRGRAGGQAAYATALVAYAGGDVQAGDAALETAVRIAGLRSPRLFQTLRLVELLGAGSSAVSERRAEELFATLLGDPTASQFARDPLDTLAVMSTPRPDAFDMWVAVAAKRGVDPALDAAEATARQRWLTALPVGGRRLAIQRLLAADPAVLPVADARRRADLLARHPQLGGLLDALARIRAKLAADLAGPAAPAADARVAVPGAAADWESYRGLSRQIGQAVAAIAAGRDFTPIDFPPFRPAADIRSGLGKRQLILSFHWTKSGLFGALESNERTAVWQVRQVAALPGEVQQLAKSLCLFDANAAIPAERLADSDWRGSAAAIERILFENSKIALAEGIDELVIVPDGWLWYVPFELLPATSDRAAAGKPAAAAPLLREACRIRYAPTRSLAVLPVEPGRPLGPIGVRAGKFYRGDKPAVAEQFLADFSAAFDRVLPVAPLAGGPPTALVASLCDDLVIGEELGGDGPLFRRPLLNPAVSPTGATGGITFADWIAPPAKRPRRMIVPGFQSAIAGGFAKVPERPGEELFLATTALVAAGAETALVSRWRTGGRVATDLVTEFLRDVAAPAGDAAPAPSESWRRAVDVVTPEPLDLAREPRVKPSPKVVIGDASHPFFWAGYMLLDCRPGGPAGADAAAARKDR